MQFSAVFALMLAQAVSQANGTPTTLTITDPDKIVCHNEMNLGSRIPFRVCRTKAEWERIGLENEKANRDLLDRSRHTNQPANSI